MQVDDAAQPPICVGTQCGFPSDQFWSCQLDRCGSEPLLNLRTMYGNGILDCCRTDLLALEQWRFPRTNILSQPILRANRMGTPQRPALHSTDRPCNLVSYTAIPPSDARLSSCALSVPPLNWCLVAAAAGRRNHARCRRSQKTSGAGTNLSVRPGLPHRSCLRAQLDLAAGRSRLAMCPSARPRRHDLRICNMMSYRAWDG